MRATIFCMMGMALMSLAACSEVDQRAKTQKIFAEKKDEKPSAGKMFGGDQAKWELALKERSMTQNETLRINTAK